MLMTRYNNRNNNLDNFGRIFDSFDRFFNDNESFYNVKKTVTTNLENAYWNKNVFSLEIPGFKKEHLTVSMIGAQLKIFAKKGDFKKEVIFSIPENLELTNPKTWLEDGILYVEFKEFDKKTDKEIFLEIK